MNPSEILIQEYTYPLPNEKIAYEPLPVRDESKLLVYKSGRIADSRFRLLADALPNDALLLFNNTKVIPARIFFTKETGGVIEIFCLEPDGRSMEDALQAKGTTEWKCLVGGASKWKPGQVLKKNLSISDDPIELKAIYQLKLEDGFLIRFKWESDYSFAEVLQAAGSIPLPPYIKRKAESLDSERYQTVFGKIKGSVAAPTAALHFTHDVFKKLHQKKIDTAFLTLNVGAGTFKPVKAERISDHHMHGEDFTISKSTLENVLTAEQVIAVGTTSLRTIESTYWLGVKLLEEKLNKDWVLEQWEVYELTDGISYKESLQAIIQWMDEHNLDELHCRTSLLIVPGYQFKIPCGLITNFHQPQSTLLLLIAAFLGDDWKKVYQHALENDYRFLSYGDSSLLWRE